MIPGFFYKMKTALVHGDELRFSVAQLRGFVHIFGNFSVYGCNYFSGLHFNSGGWLLIYDVLRMSVDLFPYACCVF